MNAKNVSAGIKVLVVEDDNDWMEKITKYLQEEGFLVFQATDYASAKKTIQSRKKQYFDLGVIILDLQLPDGNGMDLLNLILPLWNREKTKVVIATSTGWVSEDETVKKYPYYSDFITKNISDFKGDLIKAVYRAIQEREDARHEFGISG